MSNSYEITCETPMVEPDERLKIKLYDYQKSALYLYKEAELNFSEICLKIPVGTGKTIITLAHIMYNKLDNYISRPKYIIKPKNLITSNLICVGNSVFNQWKRSITDYTDLKVMYIKTYKDLQKLFDLMESKNKTGLIDLGYDVILVKKSTIKADTLKLPYDYKYGKYTNLSYKKKHKLIDMFGIYKKHYWKRVIFDDYEYDVRFFDIVGLKTIFISATTAPLNINNIEEFNYYGKRNKLRNGSYNSCKILINDKYVNDVIKMPKYFVNNIVIKCSDDKVLEILASLDLNESNDIYEMINSNSINDVKNKYGIIATNVKDIFLKILNDTYELYIQSGNIIDFIIYQFEEVLNGLKVDNNYDYTKKNLSNFKDIKYKNEKIIDMLNKEKQANIELNRKYGSSIERMKSKISQNSCPICDVEINAKSFIIMNCCQSTFCTVCITKQLKKRGKHTTCPNCRKLVKINEIIIVSENVNLEDIINEEVYNDDDEEEEDKEEEIDPYIFDKDFNKKINILLKILLNDIDSNLYTTTTNLKYKNVVNGINIMPDKKIRKIIIFVKYNQITNEIKSALKKYNVRYSYLQGSATSIQNTINDFTNSDNNEVLLLSSIKYANGINIQSATDIVLLNKVLNSGDESQIIGRAQRIGRTSNLKIWNVLNSNEV